MGVELTVGQLLSDPAQCTSAGSATRCAAADQRSALPGMCPRGADGHRPRSTKRAERWGLQRRRPRSIRMDESPADHGGRADRWSAALRSGAMQIGTIRRAMRGSRPTVGSTRMCPRVRMDTAHDPPGERSRGVRNHVAHDPFGWKNHPRTMGVELTVGQLLSDPAPCKSARSAARCAAADQRSALPGMCPRGEDRHRPRSTKRAEPWGSRQRRPRSIRMDESPADHGGRADRWSAAFRSGAMHIGRIRHAMRGSRPTVGSTRMCPRGADGHRPRSTGRAEPWGSQPRRPRSIRVDESPAVHGGRADRWSAALRSGAMQIGRIRRAMRGSRPTVCSSGVGRRWASGTMRRGTHRSPPPDRHGPGWRGCRWLGVSGHRPCVARDRSSRAARPARCGRGAD